MVNLTEFFLLIKYTILGIFQGVTEPLPISSSGHLLILKEMFGIATPGLTFEIVVNLGSLIAVFMVYSTTIKELSANGLTYLIHRGKHKKNDFMTLILLAIATIPAGTAGFVFGDVIESRMNTLSVVGISLCITGIALWMIRKRDGFKTEDALTIKDALIIGAFQALALIPGISRSGATIAACMFVGMKRESALRFSFLLYIPISAGISLLSIVDFLQTSTHNRQLILYAVAFFASIIASFFALKFFIHLMMKGYIYLFSIYCFFVGFILLYFF